MKRRTVRPLPVEPMLGRFAFVLIALLGWACDQEIGASHTVKGRARRLLAWLVVRSVTVFGWAFDRFPPVSTRHDTSIHFSGEQQW
jgi:hypothetical protein